MQYSYSRVSLFNDCPYHFKLRYIDKLHEIKQLDANNALLIGSALHEGIEKGIPTMLENYYNQFPVINNAQVHEAIKLEAMAKKVINFLEVQNEKLTHEYVIDTPEFKGIVDLIIHNADGTVNVLDFKYSNYPNNYLESEQLHIYKYFLEQQGFKVSGLGYLFIPKVGIRQKNSEDLHQFRKRLDDELANKEPQFVQVKYNSLKLATFFHNCLKIENAIEYPKNTSGNCFGCKPKFKPDYLEMITGEKGEDVKMALPKNERREKKIDTRPDIWIYGDSYTGKSTFVDGFDDLLFINTDGNTDNTTSPVIQIKDTVKKNGRIESKTLAWQTFLDTINDLETEDNDFKAVALDLYEDLREHCRNYVFDKFGWEHESDGGYGKGWDMTKREFNNAIKRLKALGYQVIYISKEVKDEVTLKGGMTRTTFRPNLDEKSSNFTTGTVDLTMRAFITSEGERKLQLSKERNVFGGGRFNFLEKTCALDMDDFLEVLVDAQEASHAKQTTKDCVAKPARKRATKKKDVEPEPDTNEDGVEVDNNGEELAEKPKRKKRTPKKVEKPVEEEEVDDVEEDDEEEEVVEKPKKKRKKRAAKVVEEPDDEEEEDDESEEVEEAPKRKRRTRKEA